MRQWLAAGLAGPAPAAEKVKVTVPAAAVTFASLYHARAAGYFAEEGLDVEIVTVPGGGSRQARIARDAQVCLTPGTSQMQAYEKGQPLLATATILNRNAINVVMHRDVAKERGITDKSPLADKIKALKGLKVFGAAVGFGLMVIHNVGGEDPDFGEFDERADHGLHAHNRRAEEPHSLRQARDERVLAQIRMRRG
jgi:ABC-type nitrate/sulfonate/bicarbonate transport system substrate-binding protein